MFGCHDYVEKNKSFQYHLRFCLANHLCYLADWARSKFSYVTIIMFNNIFMYLIVS